VKGDDPVRGVCQARRGYKRDCGVRVVLTDKQTGEII
jgi:hypothetical protein